jgi:hypothetical protein
MIRVVHPGSGCWLSPIPDPGSRGQKGTQSRIRIRNTGYLPDICLCTLMWYWPSFCRVCEVFRFNSYTISAGCLATNTVFKILFLSFLLLEFNFTIPTGIPVLYMVHFRLSWKGNVKVTKVSTSTNICAMFGSGHIPDPLPSSAFCTRKNWQVINFVLLIQAKAAGKMLFDQVCKQLNLLETDYFGLEYMDAQGVTVRLDFSAWNILSSLQALWSSANICTGTTCNEGCFGMRSYAFLNFSHV